MKKEHFKQADLTNLSSCFLDPQGNFISGGVDHEVGVHEEMACKLLDELFGEDYSLDNYDKIREGRNYTYEYLEEELGYWRYSHWVGEFGVFNGEPEKITFAQKLAIREFCKANLTTWEKVVR